MQAADWARPIDITQAAYGLANGYYLILAAALAAVCGLLLVAGVARSSGARTLLGLGAIAGAVGVGVVEFSAYGKVSDILKLYGSDSGVAYGFGLFVGAGAAVVAGLGGVLALTSKPAPAGSKAAGGQGPAKVLAAVLVAAIALGGGAYLLSQNSKTTGPGVSGSPGASGATEQPTGSLANSPTATPGSSPSFLTSGYSTREDAIQDYVEQHSVTYAGDCASPTDGDYCSTLSGAVSDSQVVYTVGPVGSDAVAWLLLQQTDDALWYVADQVPFTDSTTSPW
jgi:hypothetical protein